MLWLALPRVIDISISIAVLDDRRNKMKLSVSALNWRGILAIIVGIIALAWPGITVGVVVVIFAVYAFIDACLQVARAFEVHGGGSKLGRLLLAVLDVAVAILILAWPGATVVVAVWIIGFWALITGFMEIILAFSAGKTAGDRALLALTGVISVLLGIVFLRRPDVGAFTLAEIFGFYALIVGVSLLVMAANVHGAERRIESVNATANR